MGFFNSHHSRSSHLNHGPRIVRLKLKCWGYDYVNQPRQISSYLSCLDSLHWRPVGLRNIKSWIWLRTTCWKGVSSRWMVVWAINRSTLSRHLWNSLLYDRGEFARDNGHALQRSRYSHSFPWRTASGVLHSADFTTLKKVGSGWREFRSAQHQEIEDPGSRTGENFDVKSRSCMSWQRAPCNIFDQGW